MRSLTRSQSPVCRQAAWVGTAIIVITSLAGCGSEFGATVSGVVTLDGETITPGFVTFVPEDLTAVPAVSDLDSGGSYKLSTNKKAGLVPGIYRVSVQAFEPPVGPPGQRIYTPSKPLVPKKYLQVNTSGLEYTVEPGSNKIDILLLSK